MSNKLIPCTPEQIEILTKQPFSDTKPGTLVKDFNSLLEFIGDTGIAVSEKTQLFALNTLAGLNRLMTYPLDVKLKRPMQKSFPHINGLYLLLRSSGLSYVILEGKKAKLMLYEDVLADWEKLTPAECYFSLLQAFYYRADAGVIGERQSFFSPTCFYGCLKFFQEELVNKVDLIRDQHDRERLRYFPGLHNVALMELFGFIEIECDRALEKETWPIAKITHTDWGGMIFSYFAQNNLVMSFLEDEPVQPGTDSWENELKKYIPDWKKSLLQVERKITEEGSCIFNVSLGDASCKIAVPTDMSLDELAYGILNTFDFGSDHLYEFIYKNQYGVEECISHPYADRTHEYCTEDCPVGYLPLYKGMTFIFHYDFGDDWEFKIQVDAMPLAESAYPELTVIEKCGTPPKQYPEWDGGYEDDN